jgi:hypothetical protein
MVSGGYTELEQWVITAGFDMGREHTGCRPPGLTHLGARLEQQDVPPGEGDLPSAGGPNGSAPHHNHIPN